jgi:hypothetical protein
MNGKSAAYILVGICLILAVLMLAEVIEIILGAIIFAVALVVLGIVSKNFRNKKQKEF